MQFVQVLHILFLLVLYLVAELQVELEEVIQVLGEEAAVMEAFT
jgi:hypothetical protein